LHNDEENRASQNSFTAGFRHCEEQSDEAIHGPAMRSI
jgi:hypothetical protein